MKNLTLTLLFTFCAAISYAQRDKAPTGGQTANFSGYVRIVHGDTIRSVYQPGFGWMDLAGRSWVTRGAVTRGAATSTNYAVFMNASGQLVQIPGLFTDSANTFSTTKPWYYNAPNIYSSSKWKIVKQGTGELGIDSTTYVPYTTFQADSSAKADAIAAAASLTADNDFTGSNTFDQTLILNNNNGASIGSNFLEENDWHMQNMTFYTTNSGTDAHDVLFNFTGGSTGYWLRFRHDDSHLYYGPFGWLIGLEKKILMEGDAAADLGYTPENSTNKATAFTTVNNSLYPTVKAVNDYVVNSRATDTTASVYNHVMVYGDSFTGGLGRNSYVWWLAKFTGLNFLNAGIGGQTSEQITARYMADSSKWKYPVILQMGRNNLTEPDSIKADIARCVAAAASKGNTKYMILTIFNNAKTTEFIGQTAYTNIISLNTYLQTTYPGHVVDWRTYIVGLRRTPATHQDTLDFTNDVSPAWLRLNNGVTDTLHLSSTGYKYAAGYIAQHISMLKTDTAKVLTTSIAFNLFKGMYGNVQTNGIAFGGNDGKNTSDSSHLSYDPVAQQTTMTVTSKTNTAIGPPLNLVENYNGSPGAGFGANLPFYISGADGIKHLQGWLGYSRGVNDTTARFLLKINHNGVLNTVMKADTNFNTIFGMGAGVYVPTSTVEAWGQGSQFALDYNSSKRSTFTVNLNGDLVLQNTRLMGIDVTPVGALLQTPVGATNVAGLKISRGNKLATITGGIQDGAIEVDTVSTSAANFDVNMIIGSTRKHFVLTSGLQAAGDIPYYATATNSYSRLTLGGAGTVLHGGSTAPSYTSVVTADIASNAITYAKMQAGTTAKLFGTGSGTAFAEIGLGNNLSFSGSTLNWSAPTIGSLPGRTIVADANYTQLTTDYAIAYTSLTAARTVTLVAIADKQTILVKDEAGTAATNNITINAPSGKTIDGASSKVINTNNGFVKLYYQLSSGNYFTY